MRPRIDQWQAWDPWPDDPAQPCPIPGRVDLGRRAFAGARHSGNRRECHRMQPPDLPHMPSTARYRCRSGSDVADGVRQSPGSSCCHSALPAPPSTDRHGSGVSPSPDRSAGCPDFRDDPGWTRLPWTSCLRRPKGVCVLSICGSILRHGVRLAEKQCYVNNRARPGRGRCRADGGGRAGWQGCPDPSGAKAETRVTPVPRAPSAFRHRARVRPEPLKISDFDAILRHDC